MYTHLTLKPEHLELLDRLDRVSVVFAPNRLGPWRIGGMKAGRVNAARVNALADAGYLTRSTADAFGTPEYRVRVNRAGAAVVHDYRAGHFDPAEDYLKHEILMDLTGAQESQVKAWAKAELGLEPVHAVVIPDADWFPLIGLGIFKPDPNGVKNCGPVTHCLSERGRFIAERLLRLEAPDMPALNWDGEREGK